MNILLDSNTPVTEAQDIWEPSWNVGMEAVRDPPTEEGNLLDVEDEIILEECPGLPTTDGQQYFASWLASKVIILFDIFGNTIFQYVYYQLGKS